MTALRDNMMQHEWPAVTVRIDGGDGHHLPWRDRARIDCHGNCIYHCGCHRSHREEVINALIRGEQACCMGGILDLPLLPCCYCKMVKRGLGVGRCNFGVLL